MLKTTKIVAQNIKIDPSYQRPLDEDRVEQIAEAFDPDRVGAIYVSRRKDGFHYALDGQHRVAGAVKAGYKHPLICLVHEGLSLDEEADWFLRYNNGRVKIEAMAKFRARLTAKEPTALEINNIVHSLGLSMSPSPSAKTICAVEAAEWVHIRRKNLEQTLAALKHWAQVDQKAFDGKLIRATAIFLSHCTQADPNVLAAKLVGEQPVIVMSQMKMAAADYPRWVAGCLTLRKIYNKKNRNPLAPLDWLNE